MVEDILKSKFLDASQESTWQAGLSKGDSQTCYVNSFLHTSLSTRHYTEGIMKIYFLNIYYATSKVSNVGYRKKTIADKSPSLIEASLSNEGSRLQGN